MTKKTELRPLPSNLSTSTLAEIQDLHSQMLATASDLGYEPPNDCLVEIEEGDEEAGREIVARLHAALTEHRERAPLADQGKTSHTAADGGAPKSPKKNKSAAEKMAEQKAARLARDAAKPATEKEDTVAQTPKKSTKSAKKAPAKAAKKSAKKAPAKKAAKAAKKETTTRRAPEGKISWIYSGEGNGTREGTGRHERRELLRKHNGKTVETYLKAGGSVATLNRAVEEKAVRVVA